MRHAAFSLPALGWLAASLGVFIPDTGTRQRIEILEKLGEQAGGASIQSVNYGYFNAAVKDNWGKGDDYWDLNDGKHQGQLYKYVDDYFDWTTRKGPIFLLIGAEVRETDATKKESALRDDEVASSSFINYAASLHNALVVGLEHRYYGVTRPTTVFDGSLLNSEQALADVARFLPWFKNEYSLDPDTPVIVFGYSYGGNLAAWFKIKYPSAALGAISSSGPVLAKVDFSAYQEVVGQALVTWGGQACYDVVRAGADAYYNKLTQGQAGYTALNTALGINTIVDLESGIDKGLEWMVGPLSDTVQYNGFRPTSVAQFCTDMVQLKSTYNGDAYQAFVSWMRNKGSVIAAGLVPQTPLDENAGKMWTWQFCNEFGYLQTTVSSQQPFYAWSAWNTKAQWEVFCNATQWGYPLLHNWPDVDYTNNYYGGLDISADNITFVHGSLDPWHRLGIEAYHAFNPHLSSVYYVDKGSHCNDGFRPNSATPASIVKVTDAIIRDIQHYLDGNPWDHHSTDPVVNSVSLQSNKAGGGAQSSCGYDVVVKRTKPAVKYGEQMKIQFSIRSRRPPGGDPFVVGVEHWDSSLHFVKGSSAPAVNKARKGPTLEHVGAVYWEDVPNRRVRAFKASFFSDRKAIAEFHPGACLQNATGGKYCCKLQTVQVRVVDL